MRAWLDAILRGMASIFSFGASDVPRLPDRSDADAIASDWRAVGDDLRTAIKTEASNRTYTVDVIN